MRGGRPEDHAKRASSDTTQATRAGPSREKRTSLPTRGGPDAPTSMPTSATRGPLAAKRQSRSTDPEVSGERPTVAGLARRASSKPPAGPYAPGDRIAGRYRVDVVLGKGGFGEVYRVFDDRQNGKAIALKVHLATENASVLLAALRDEFALLASLGHPHLAKVYDFGYLEGNRAYFTQELVAGEPMQHAIGKIDEPRTIRVLVQLCQALEYLHARGILHRDIKPSNVLVDLEREHLTLLDFGIASALSTLEPGRIAGTFTYIAPEAALGGAIDARADLYSLGVTLYRIATGEVPFGGETEALLRAHAFEPPPPLPDHVPRPIAEVIERLLRKEPGERYASAIEVAAALGKAAGVEVALETGESLASYVLSGRFIGQKKAFDVAMSNAMAAASGPAPLLLVGDAGTGKSRLLREVRQQAQLYGRKWIGVDALRSVSGRSLMHELTDAVVGDEVAAALSDDDRRELARELPRLRRRGEQLPLVVDPERSAALRLDALARALELAFRARAGVVAVEDLHFATPQVVSAIANLSRRAREERARCAFFFTSRPAACCEAIERDARATQARCELLDPSAIPEFLGSMFGDATLLARTPLGEVLSSETSSALFIQESLRLAIEERRIERRDGRWLVSGQLDALPLHEVLARRAQHLDEREHAIAVALAVLGRPASVREAAGVAGVAPPKAAFALRALIGAGIIEERTDARARLLYVMHDRFVETVLGEAAPRALASANRNAADVLTRSAKDALSRSRVAAHWLAAGATPKAAKAFEEAAELAEDEGKPDYAVELLDHAMRSGVARTSKARRQRLARRYDLAVKAGARAIAQDTLARWSADLDDATPQEHLALSRRRAVELVKSGDGPGARSLVLEAIAGGAEQGKEAARLYVTLGEIEGAFGKIEDAFAAYERAASLARASRDAETECRAWLGASLAAAHAHDARMLEFAEHAVRDAESIEDRALLADAVRQLGNAQRERGMPKRAIATYRRAVKASRAAGSPEHEGKALNCLGTVAQWLGRVDEAIAAYRRSIELKERIRAVASARISYNNFGSLMLAVGHFGDADASFRRVVDAGGDETQLVVVMARTNLADLAVLRGDLNFAIDLYEKSLGHSTARGYNGDILHNLGGLVRARLLRGRSSGLPRCVELLDKMIGVHAAAPMPEAPRWIETTAALVREAEGDLPGALAHVHRALATMQREAEFEMVFATKLECMWLAASMHARSGHETEAARWVDRSRAELDRRLDLLQGEGARSTFVSGHPMHGAIRDRDLFCRPGTLWRD